MSVMTPINLRHFTVVLTVLTLSVIGTKSMEATKQEYYSLMDYLFKDYKKDVRPAWKDSDITDIYIAFSLYSILNVNEQDQTLKTNAMLQIRWYDKYLEFWENDDYKNISSFLVSQSSVWLPDIVVGNTVTSQMRLGYNDLQVRVYRDGYVTWLPTGVFETSCDFDITYFPFDTQVCNIVFTSAISGVWELSIHIDKGNGVIDLSKFSQDGIWEVVNMSASNEEAENRRAQISFSLQLKRRPTFYVLNVILPVVLMAMTSSLVFALPVESGEKMSLSITVLLAFAVYLTLITDAMPKTSVRVSVLMVYVIQLLALTVMSVILSVPLIKLHHRSSDKPLGTKATKVIVLLRNVMCMSADQRLCKVAEANTSSQNGGRISIVSEHKHNAIAPCNNRHDNDSPDPSAESSRRSREVSPVSGEVASETISMFLFYVFFLYSIVVTVVYIVILINGGASQEESTRLT